MNVAAQPETTPEFFSRRLNYFDNVKATNGISPASQPTLSEAIEYLKAPPIHIRDTIEKIRAANTKEEADRIKKTLPAFQIASCGPTRGMVEENGFMQVDVDQEANAEASVEVLKGKICKHPAVAIIARSPRGGGVKVVLRVPVGEGERGWKQFRDWLREQGVVVDEGKHNTSDMCFVTWDPELLVNPNAVELALAVEAPLPPAGAPSQALSEAPLLVAGEAAVVSGLFGPGKNLGTPNFDPMKKLEAGGVSGTTRWDGFNQVAGFFISMVRRGELTMVEGLDRLKGWVLVNMNPRWDEAKVEKDWATLVRIDIQNHGAISTEAQRIVPRVTFTMDDFIATVNQPRLDLADSVGKSAQDILNEYLPPYVLKGLMREGELTLLAAEQKTRKTYLLIALALHVAAGETFLGFEIVRAMNVMILDFELNKRSLEARVRAVLSGLAQLYAWDDEKVKAILSRLRFVALRGVACRDKVQLVAEIISELNRDWFVTIDSFQAIFQGEHNSVGEVREAMAKISEATARTGVSALLIDHFNKNDSAQGSARVSGSAAKLGAADNVIILERVDPLTVWMKFTDIRDSLAPQSLYLKYDCEHMMFEATEQKKKLREALAAYFTDLFALGLAQRFTLNDLKQAKGDSASTVNNKIKLAVQHGVVERVMGAEGKLGKAGAAFLYRVTSMFHPGGGVPVEVQQQLLSP